MSTTAPLLSLPIEILITLPSFVYTLEDFMNLSSTCRTLRHAMAAASPHDILQLAAAQSTVFFRPSPHFLATAVARELGTWARKTASNEDILAQHLQMGVEGVLELALGTARCGLTMERIRELYEMRFSIINPVTDILDKCVGRQWYAIPGFWNTVDDAYTINSEPSETLFHLAMYGELFAPDFEPFLSGDKSELPRLTVDTRLEFIKYCVPDFKCSFSGFGHPDPRRAVKETGPYAKGPDGTRPADTHDHNTALTWVIRSSRFRPLYRKVRTDAGVEEFQEKSQDEWRYMEDSEHDWRQRLLEHVMVCQGLQGLGMLRPDMQHQWDGKIRAWKQQIARIDREPRRIMVGRQATLEYPYLLGDLSICGYPSRD
ncbi:hypothetical protein GGR57DRAFT_484617 [Xylariaceae sp. FL1272]|nr:hypothetical protein GGR57DRAFT_484617 [Xylariaceae sp. FL1272]